MNVNSLIDLVIRQVMRRAINKGLSAGIDVASRQMSRGKTPGDPEAGAPPTRGQSPEARNMARGVSQAARLTRKLGRF